MAAENSDVPSGINYNYISLYFWVNKFSFDEHKILLSKTLKTPKCLNVVTYSEGRIKTAQGPGSMTYCSIYIYIFFLMHWNLILFVTSFNITKDNTWIKKISLLKTSKQSQIRLLQNKDHKKSTYLKNLRHLRHKMKILLLFITCIRFLLLLNAK